MRSQMAADQDRAMTFVQSGEETLEAAHVESLQDGFVGLAIERVVARRTARCWPPALDQVVSIGQSASRAARARSAPRGAACHGLAVTHIDTNPNSPRYHRHAPAPAAQHGNSSS